MHRYEELEILYHKKKIRKVVLIIVLIITAFLSIFSLTHNKQKNYTNNEKNKTKSIKTSKKMNNQKTPKKKAMTFTVYKLEQNKQNSSSSTPMLTFRVSKIQPITNKLKNDKKKQLSDQKKVNKLVKKNNFETSANSFIKEKSIDIKKLINSFNKTPNYDIAMMISRYYFTHKNYNKAKAWALKANNIDPSKYQSWKMFALILLKKNQKDKAKKVLSIYLDDYGNNEEIEKLLRSIYE